VKDVFCIVYRHFVFTVQSQGSEMRGLTVELNNCISMPSLVEGVSCMVGGVGGRHPEKEV
jgi:hypothetical protein